MISLAIILPYDLKLLSVAAILDVFETTNKICREEKKEIPFNIQLFQTPDQIEKGGHTFHGYPVGSIDDDHVSDLVLIPAFTTDDMKETISRNRVYLPWLHQQYNAGAEIASFCTGAFLFGASGLLDGKSATSHVDAIGAFSRTFPAVQVKPGSTVTVDGRCYTSGGSTSTFHLLILLVQKYCGNEVAIRIAKIFAIDMDRHQQSYFSTFRPNYAHNDELVKKMQRKIEQNYLNINSIEEIVKELPSSRRNIVRRFKQVTGIPPITYLQYVRIEQAKKRLEQTNQSISEVISYSGYTDPKSFRKTFHKLVGMPPMEYREKFKVK